MSLFCTMESGERAAVPCMATAKLSKTSLAACQEVEPRGAAHEHAPSWHGAAVQIAEIFAFKGFAKPAQAANPALLPHHQATAGKLASVLRAEPCAAPQGGRPRRAAARTFSEGRHELFELAHLPGSGGPQVPPATADDSAACSAVARCSPAPGQQIRNDC